MYTGSPASGWARSTGESPVRAVTRSGLRLNPGLKLSPTGDMEVGPAGFEPATSRL
jgi:hypothetical protein